MITSCLHADGLTHSKTNCRRCGALLFGDISGVKHLIDLVRPTVCPNEILQGLFLAENQVKYPACDVEQTKLIFLMGEILSQSTHTIHLAVRYLDKVIDLGYEKGEVTVTTCLFIASKFNELDENIPLIGDMIKTFSAISKTAMTISAIQKAETDIIKLLDWDFDFIIPLHFVNNLLQ